jgi:two-component system, OmpR family, sensor kinase
MSSSRPADRPVSATRFWAPRTWSLRARLLVTLVALLAAVCAGIGVATEFALQRFLTNQLDDQLVEAGRRSVAIFEFGPPRPPEFRPPHPPRPPEMPGMPGMPEMPGPPPGPPPPDPPEPPDFAPRRVITHESPGSGPDFLNAPGQALLQVGAVLTRDAAPNAGVITADGSRATISEKAADQLAAVRPGGRPVTVQLDGLGRYRVVALHARGPEAPIVVTGLPTSDVDDALLWVLAMFCVVAAVVLIAAAAAGILIIRRQLEPLSRVSAAARDVADLELDRGEVLLPTAIAKVDPAAAHTEVGQLASALNRMLDRIAAALSARYASETRVRQFVADASHELRTPLAAIRGYTELAQRKRAQLPDDVAHAMSRVESETDRMTRLVEDMLLLARLDTGRPLEREAVDLSRLVVDTVSDAHIAGPEHRWSLDLPDEPVLVAGDEARLHQVLANLLANARTHTPPGTSVTVSLAVAHRPGADRAVLRVSDDGPGIPEWLQPEVFERFARGDSSRSRRMGSTGLGLAIVAAVVKAHDGTIELTSAPGETNFTVSLPVADSQATHSADKTGA